jgi:hypothetical protein
MKTPKFMQFDEAKAIEAYDDSTGQGCYTQCLHMARHQHQCDQVVMLKLWEIIEMQKKELMFLDDVCECRSVFETQNILESVETMIEQLNKGE